MPGGLVGAASYDLVRRFERLPPRIALTEPTPEAHYLAPRSLLVFDHLTRGVALAPCGERIRTCGAAPGSREGIARRDSAQREKDQILAGDRQPERTTIHRRRRSRQGIHRGRRRLSAGVVGSLCRAMRAGAVRSLSGAAIAEPFSLYVLLRTWRRGGRRLVTGSVGEVVEGSRVDAAHRRHAAARRDSVDDGACKKSCWPIPRKTPSTSCWSIWRATTWAASRAPARQRQSLSQHRALQPRDAHRQWCERRTRAGQGRFRFVRRRFPAGTLVGAPKVRAMEIIDELEPVRRGFYGGTVGYFGHGGDMDHAITIRTMVFRGDTYSFQAGAGVVADSVPADRISGSAGEERHRAPRPGVGGGRIVKNPTKQRACCSSTTTIPSPTTWCRPSWCWARKCWSIATTASPSIRPSRCCRPICVFRPAPARRTTPVCRCA